jgi:hypothetical protein
MPGTPTLPSRQRARVLDTYRSRGHRNSNLWLVYSVKQDQDILLHSDRSLVHWLAFLETDPSVRGFRPITDELVAQLDVGPAGATILERQDRQLEVHLVADGRREVTSVETGVGPAKVRVITADELQAHSRIALRWLKAIGYAGLARFSDLTPVLNQLIPSLERRWSGKVADLLEDLPGFDLATVYAALVKAAIHGSVELDLTSHGLCGASRWKRKLTQAR